MRYHYRIRMNALGQFLVERQQRFRFWPWRFWYSLTGEQSDHRDPVQFVRFYWHTVYAEQQPWLFTDLREAVSTLQTMKAQDRNRELAKEWSTVLSE